MTSCPSSSPAAVLAPFLPFPLGDPFPLASFLPLPLPPSDALPPPLEAVEVAATAAALS